MPADKPADKAQAADKSAKSQPQPGQQAQAQTKEPVPNAPDKKAPTPQASEPARPTGAKAKAQASATPIVMLRPDSNIFETNAFKALADKRKRLVEERSEIAKRLSFNHLALQEVSEKLNFLLTPSPIFAQNAVEGLDAVTKPFVTEVKQLAEDILALFREKPKTASLTAEDIEAVMQKVLGGPGAETEDGGPDLRPAPIAGELDAATSSQVEPDEDEEFEFEDESAHEEPEVPDHDWTDALSAPLAPGLDDMPLDLISLAGTGELTTIVLSAMLSSHIANLACEMARKNGISVACIYVRYKAAPKEEGKPWRVSDWYRYAAFDAQMWADVVSVTRQKMQGIAGASIGSFVERNIKAAHEDKRVECQRLTRDGVWVNVPTRAERKTMSSPPPPTPAAVATAPKAVPSAARPAAPRPAPPTPNAPASSKGMATVGELLRSKGQSLPAPAERRDDLDDAFLTD